MKNRTLTTNKCSMGHSQHLTATTSATPGQADHQHPATAQGNALL